MKRGGSKLEMTKPGAVHCQKRGAVVSQLVLKLKESVPPPPPNGGRACIESYVKGPNLWRGAAEEFCWGLFSWGDSFIVIGMRRGLVLVY